MAATYFLRKTPFIRIFLLLAVGIVTGWYLKIPLSISWLGLFLGCFLIVIRLAFSLVQHLRFAFLGPIAVAVSFISLGSLLVYYNDVRTNARWLGNYPVSEKAFVATLQEPLVEKPKSFKAESAISLMSDSAVSRSVQARVIIYFSKDTLLKTVGYGSQIVFKKPLQEIKGSGNPGAFDYKRYALFQGITYQVYLQKDDFLVLPSVEKKPVASFLLTVRHKVLAILKENIKGEKETGLAEALLIGYKDDLDKNLVQSYTNTGVVHIIAISGLHLGLIYWLLVVLLKPLVIKKSTRWLQPIIIITGLWFFALLTGAQPSILRSAVMFTCIVLAQSISRKSSIYNTLAFSAFILLCYNPFWLWDVGFQLSYAAVLSIVIFFRPVYNLLYVKNKLLDAIWKMNAVTIAAQLLTLPLSIYHFHQFPLHFLLTNFVAVPLSSLILLGEILLCAIYFIPLAAAFLGKILTWFIYWMNTFIEQTDKLPWFLLQGLQISIVQAALLYVFIGLITYAVWEKNKQALKAGFLVLLLFFVIRSYSFYSATQQRKMIVYNIPGKRAIDFVDGRKYVFEGDTSLLSDDFARNFHLNPSRILHRMEPARSLSSLQKNGKYYSFSGKKIILIDTAVRYLPINNPPTIDVLIISGSPRFYLKDFTKSFAVKTVIFDGNVAAFRVNQWKKDCASLHIPWYAVNEKGAFVMNLP